MLPVYAGWAARAFAPDRSGGWSVKHRNRDSWPSTATKANPARSRTVIISKRTPTNSWKGCCSRRGPWKPRKSISTCATNILTSMNCSREIAAFGPVGWAFPPRIELRRGAGAYICGEETAMLESLEGKRGYPPSKPPFPTQVGLFGRPTLIHNVETLYWIRDVIERGPDWLASEGRNGRHGLRSFSVSGRVKEPGVKFAPAGISVRELIDEFCGGMTEGHAFKAYLPGGASGGILPARLGDLPLDFGTLEAYGCFIGSAAVVIFSDQDDLRAVALNLMRFFEDESCGQCTPCRVGTEKAVALIEPARLG